jgi:hypothetical protein
MKKLTVFMLAGASVLFASCVTKPVFVSAESNPNVNVPRLTKYAIGEITNTLIGKTWNETLKLSEAGSNSFSITLESNLPDHPYFVYMDKYGLQHKIDNVTVNGKVLIVHGLTLQRLFEEHEPSFFMAIMDITNLRAMWNCSFQFISP